MLLFQLLAAALATTALADNRINRGEWTTLTKKMTQIIGHRGERAYMPEHTLASYHLAMFSHVDYVEPDLVLTKDGHVVLYHDLCIKSNTDIASRPEFAHLKKDLSFDDTVGSGGMVHFKDDWCISDFTLEELKTVKIHVNPRGPTSMRPTFFNNLFTIPTFEEYLDLVHDVSKQIGRKFGVIPELKHCYYHSTIFGEHYFEDKVLDILEKKGYPLNGPPNPENGPLVIQNFEVESAKYLSEITKGTQRDILLLVYTNPELMTYKGLAAAAEYATTIGALKEYYTMGAESVLKSLSVSYDHEKIASLGGFVPSSKLADYIRELKMKQTPYTFYSGYEQKDSFCQEPCGCSKVVDRREELFYFFRLGMDGLFTENNIEALQLRTEYQGLLDLERGATKVTPTVDYSRRLKKRGGSEQVREGELEKTRIRLAEVHAERLQKKV